MSDDLPKGRRYPRFMCNYPVRVSSGGNGRLVDLSLGGARLKVDSNAQIGAVVSVSIALPGHWFRMKLRARVVHQSNESMGVEFEKLSSRQRQALQTVLEALALQDPTNRQVVPRGVSSS